MNPYAAYRKPETSSAWTRMDVVVALYDKALERLDRAAMALRTGDEPAAVQQLLKVQFTVTELAAGVRVEATPEMGTNLLRLYEFVAHQLSQPTPDGVANARKILATLREGFESIRAEANEFERSGGLAAAGRPELVSATA